MGGDWIPTSDIAVIKSTGEYPFRSEALKVLGRHKPANRPLWHTHFLDITNFFG